MRIKSSNLPSGNFVTLTFGRDCKVPQAHHANLSGTGPAVLKCMTVIGGYVRTDYLASGLMPGVGATFPERTTRYGTVSLSYVLLLVDVPAK